LSNLKDRQKKETERIKNHYFSLPLTKKKQKLKNIQQVKIIMLLAPPNSSLFEDFLLVGKFSFKNIKLKNLGAKLKF